jgi:hypothetical protein
MIRRVGQARRLARATLAPGAIVLDARHTCRSRPDRTAGLGLEVALDWRCPVAAERPLWASLRDVRRRVDTSQADALTLLRW